MTNEELKTIIKERCGFSSNPCDHMVDPIILDDIASRTGEPIAKVQSLYAEVDKEMELAFDDWERNFFQQEQEA